MKRFFTLSLLCFFVFSLFAQLPPPCPSNTTPPSDLCDQPCIYCDFYGLQSSTAGYSGQTPNGFCGTIENEQWLGFVAGEASATFTALPGNCADGNGVQIAVYEDCSGTPLNCYGGTGGGASVPASVSVTGMVPGQNYYVLIDGFAGDQCDFTMIVSPPSAITPSVPDEPLPLSWNTELCTTPTTYCVEPVYGAGAYTWTAPVDALINGMPSPHTILGQDGACVEITFGSSTGQVCVNATNSCYTGPPFCQPISEPYDWAQTDVLVWPDEACIFEEYAFEIDENFSVTNYTWTGPPGSSINGITLPYTINGSAGASVFIEFGNTLGEVCVIVGDDCTDRAMYCQNVEEVPIPEIPVPDDWPLEACTNTVYSFEIEPSAGAATYTWSGPPNASINGVLLPVNLPAGQGESVDIRFATDVGLVCVSAINECDETTQFCQDIVLQDSDPILLPDTSLCPENLPYTLPWGDIADMSGVFSGLVPNTPCDALSTQTVEVLPPGGSSVLPPISLCAGECAEICGQQFCSPGQYQKFCSNNAGCDSMVAFTVSVLSNQAEILTTQTTPCATLPQILTAQGNVGDFVWKNTQGMALGTGTALFVNDLGTYILEVTTPLGMGSCVFTDSITLSCPPDLPCTNNGNDASDMCQITCLSCNLQDLSGNTGGFMPDSPTGFCGSTVQNGQWYGFQAGAINIDIQAAAGNCQNGDGLQMAIYQSCTDNPLACSAGAVGGAATALGISYNDLTVGETYYLMIAGMDGDVCDFSLNISPNNATERPFAGQAGQIFGATSACPNSTANYSIAPVPGATAYTWTAPAGATINGQTPPLTLPANIGASVNINFGPNPSGAVCVTAADACGVGQPFCMAVSKAVNPVTVLPDTLLCFNAFPYTCPCGGQTLFFAGTCVCHYTAANGCDSTVQRYIGISHNIATYLPPMLTCGDECLELCNEEFCDFGFHQYTCETQSGCDESYYFFLINFDPQAEILNGDALSCPPFPVWLSANPSGGLMEWTTLSGQFINYGPKIRVSQYGTYILNVTQSYGSQSCTVSDTIVISCPQTFSPENPNLVFSKKENSQFRVQPTISTGEFWLKSTQSEVFIEKIRVFDLHGRMVRQAAIEPDMVSFFLDLSAEPQGVYVVSAYLNGKWEQARVVKM